MKYNYTATGKIKTSGNSNMEILINIIWKHITYRDFFDKRYNIHTNMGKDAITPERLRNK